MNEKQMIVVRNLFAAHGNAEEPVRLSGGWTNHVFAAGDMVLRCTEDMQSGRLLRETQLAGMLPPQVGYPEIIDSGCTENLIWTLCRRISGMNLEDAWGTMTWDKRADALGQLWARVQKVHELDVEMVQPFVNEHLWYFTAVENAQNEIELLREKDIVRQDESDVLKGYIHRLANALKQATLVPVHGDLTPANAMWCDGRIAALMDFECAAIAPKEADLMMLLNTAYERLDLPTAAHDPAAESRFNDRMLRLVRDADPDWDILQGYRGIKLMHHVFMDMDDDDFSPEHEELVCLRALMQDGRGRFDSVLP